MTEYFKTYVASVNVNKMGLLIKSVSFVVQVLFAKTGLFLFVLSLEKLHVKVEFVQIGTANCLYLLMILQGP